MKEASIPPSKADQKMHDLAMLQSLASVNAMFGRMERAIDMLHLALWLAPRDPETMRLMAVFCYNDGRFEQAASLVSAYEATGKPMPKDLALIKLRYTH